MRLATMATNLDTTAHDNERRSDRFEKDEELNFQDIAELNDNDEFEKMED